MSNSSTLPNPNVYLNYLPPELAFAWELVRDVYLVTCGALMWDMLSSIPKDLNVFRRFNAGVLVYGLCRPAALAFVLTAAITETSPLPNCFAMTLGNACSGIVATATSSFLFLWRIQVVYSHSQLVRYAFFVLWLVQVGSLVLIPLGASSGPLYDTGYCIDSGAKKSVIGASIMLAIFDSLVFGFISYHLVTTHANNSDHSRWRTFFFGNALPRLSKAMLQGGQQYYLLTVCMNVAIVAIIGSPSTPTIYQIILVVPTVALTSVVACKVQRDLFERRLEGLGTESSSNFVDITGLLTRSYRSEGVTSHTRHVSVQINAPES